MSCSYCEQPTQAAILALLRERSNKSMVARALGLSRVTVIKQCAVMERSGCIDGTCTPEAAVHCAACAYGRFSSVIAIMRDEGKTRADCAELAQRLSLSLSTVIAVYTNARGNGCLTRERRRIAERVQASKPARPMEPPPVAAWRLPPIGSVLVAA